MDTVIVGGKEVIVLRRKHINSNRTIILTQGWNDVTPFVVWTYIDGQFLGGSYCSDFSKALSLFDDRKH
jgi:hypothetical protein